MPEQSHTTSHFPGTVVIRQRVITTYRADLFRLLAQRCDRLIVIAGRPADSEGVAITNSILPGEIIPVENRELGSGGFLIYWQQDLMRHIERLAPDVIVTEANPRFTDTTKLRRWATGHGIPMIGWGLGTTNFFNRKFLALRSWRQRKTIAKFDAIIAYSERAARQYAQAGFSADKIHVAHNATVRPRTIPERPPSRAGDDFRIVTIGRLVAHKNIELLIQAVANLTERYPEVSLHIVGDGPHRQNLEQLASSLPVDCHFHGHQQGDQLSEIAGGCHLFVLPGLGGLAIQEAMALGLPVIVSEADGTELDLVREANGWRIPANDVDELSAAIIAAMSDRPATQEMGKESNRIIREEINVETMADKFLDAIISTTR